MRKHGLFAALALLACLVAVPAWAQTTTTAAPTTTTAAPTTTTAVPTTTTAAPTTTLAPTTTTAAPTTTTAAPTTTTTTTTSTTTTTTLGSFALVQNKDCTGLHAASGLTSGTVNCCTAAKNGFCVRRENFGHLFEVFATFAGTGTYDTGGTVIPVGVLGQAGIGKGSTVVSALCSPSSSGLDPSLLRSNAFGVPSKAVLAGATGGSTSLANEAFECLIFWY